MIRFVLDTDAISYALRGHGQVRHHLNNAAPGQVGMTTVTAFEVLKGMRRRRVGEAQQKAFALLMAELDIVPFDLAAADHAADIAASLARAGTPIGSMDTLIAGIARSRGLTLVTRNLREFGRVPGLMLEDWY